MLKGLHDHLGSQCDDGGTWNWFLVLCSLSVQIDLKLALCKLKGSTCCINYRFEN